MNATSKKTTTTTTKYEYMAPVPYPHGHAKDVQDALAMAINGFKSVAKDAGRDNPMIYDDSIRVRVTDDLIVFWFEEEVPVTARGGKPPSRTPWSDTLAELVERVEELADGATDLSEKPGVNHKLTEALGPLQSAWQAAMQMEGVEVVER